MTSIKTNGTSLRGHFQMPYAKLVELIGKPNAMSDGYKTDVYSLSAININSNEYVTSWVVNKSLHKIIYNHLIFRDNILFKYDGLYDEVGRIQLTDTRHLRETDRNLFGYTTDLNSFIGINLPVFAETINRPLKKIHDLQVQLLDMCEENVTNKFPYAVQVTELK